MANDILYESKQLIIKDNGDGILFYKIIGFVNIDLINTIDKEMESAIIKTGAQKIISDTREMKVISVEAQEYNNNNLIPRWEKLGIKYNALILSSNAFGQWTLQVLKQKYETRSSGGGSTKGFLVNMFKDEESAMAWITQQE